MISEICLRALHLLHSSQTGSAIIITNSLMKVLLKPFFWHTSWNFLGSRVFSAWFLSLQMKPLFLNPLAPERRYFRYGSSIHEARDCADKKDGSHDDSKDSCGPTPQICQSSFSSLWESYGLKSSIQAWLICATHRVNAKAAFRWGNWTMLLSH